MIHKKCYLAIKIIALIFNTNKYVITKLNYKMYYNEFIIKKK